MWRRVLFVLFVVGKGTLAADGTNRDVFEKLCNITRGLKGLMEKVDGAESSFRGALYGEGSRTSFDENGSVTRSGCGLNMASRSTYCSHKQPGGGSIVNGHGCFGDSLLGTFLCTCVPGQRDQKDLCGLRIEQNGVGWVGWGSWGGPPEDLSQEVWKRVNQKCFKNNTAKVGTLEHLEDLKNAVEGIKEEAKKKNFNSGYYLGSSTNTHGICGGTRQGDACVSYPPKTGSGEEPDIPWAEKIVTEIPKLEKTIKQQISLQDSTQTDQQGHEGHSDEDPGEEQEGEEEEGEEEPAQNPGLHNPTKPPRQKRKRQSTSKQRTEQPAEPLKAILHDDSTFLPKPFWLLSAVFI